MEGGSRFSLKNGGGVIHIGGVSIKGGGGRHFVWMDFVAIMLFTQVVFDLGLFYFLTPNDIKNCYYFKSNLSLVLLIKKFLTKKHVMLF